MDLIQQPKKELLSVMLASPLVLAGVFVNQRLEPDRDFRVVLEAPQALEKGG